MLNHGTQISAAAGAADACPTLQTKPTTTPLPRSGVDRKPFRPGVTEVRLIGGRGEAIGRKGHRFAGGDPFPSTVREVAADPILVGSGAQLASADLRLDQIDHGNPFSSGVPMQTR